MSRSAFFLVLASLSFSCGPTTAPKPCNFQTCNGCCDATGECQSGFSPNACGVLGASCQVCTGSICQSGACIFSNTGGGSGGGTGGGTGGGATGGGSGGGATGGGTGGGATGGGTGGGVTGGGTGGGVTGGGTGGGTTGGGGGATQPGDTCNNPTPLSFDSSGTASFSGDNSLYTNDGQGSCGDSRERVFSFVVNEATWVEISTTGLLAYHLRSTCTAASSEVWCASTVGKQLVQPGTYYLWAEGSGVYSLRVRKLPGETCETATNELLFGTNSSTVTGSLDSYEHHVSSTCSASGPDRAYLFVTATDRSFSASLTQVNGFTGRLVLQSLASDCNNPIAEGCQSGSTTNADVSLRRGNLPAGRYVLWVKGSTTGTYTLSATLAAPVMGETCDDPLFLTFSGGSASISGDTSTFFPDTTANSTNVCATNGSGNDVVYMFTQSVAGTLTVNVTAGSGTLRPVVYLRSACGTAMSDVGCGQATTSGGSASFTSTLAAGTYYLVVDSFGTGGPFALTATQTAMSVTASDTCTGATTPLISSAGTVTVTGNTSTLIGNYTSGTVNGCSGSGGGPDGVYLIQHPTSSTFTANITATGTNTYRPIMYLRTSCTSSTTDVACAPNDMGSCTFSSGTLTATSLAAGTYYLIVDTCGASATGAYSLTVTQ